MMSFSSIINRLQQNFKESSFIDVDSLPVPLQLTLLKDIAQPINAAFFYPKSLIEISGDDARDFLQGLSTADILKAKQGKLLKSLFTDVKGKILFDCFIKKIAENNFIIYCEPGENKKLLNHLDFYHITENCSFNEIEPMGLWYILGKQPQEFEILCQLNGLAICDQIDPDSLKDWQIVGLSEFDEIRPIFNLGRSGIDFDSNFIPAEAGLNYAVSYLKGCFIGQEIIARTEHKGRPKSLLTQIKHSQILEVNDKITLDGFYVGDITSSSKIKFENGFYSLAHLKHSAVMEATLESHFMANNQAIKILQY